AHDRAAAESETDCTSGSSSYVGIAREVAARLDELAKSRGIRVDVQSRAPCDSVAPRDPKNVSHALFNVLENAIVAAKSHVRVYAEARDEELVVSVVDDGPGIDSPLLAHAFEPFVTTKSNGMGMGLAIARAAVKDEGGLLRLNNRGDGGLRVDFVFPIAARI